MLSKKVFLAACAVASLCAAQSVNIRGMVKDKAGAGISGATVKLEAANLSTTSGSDGSFNLTGMLTGIREKDKGTSFLESPITFQNGRLRFSLSENTLVAIKVHDAGGRRIRGSERVYLAGTYLLPFPADAASMHWNTVAIGQNITTFKSSPAGWYSGEEASESSRPSSGALSKQGKASAVFRDVLSIVKAGQINHRDSIKTLDTSGIMIQMIPNAGNVTDADGNVYQSVRIGDQVWTVENLKSTKYNDGTPIPLVTDNTEWTSLATGAHCFYDNDPANKDKYGAMYHWYTVRTGRIAPVGWHVPTDVEWEALNSFLITNGYNWDGTTTGNRVAKSLAAKTDWISSELAGSVGNGSGANNSTGFSALPGGGRHDAGPIEDRFIAKDSTGFWWSSVPESGGDTTRAWLFSLYHNRTGLVKNVHYKKYALSVRLLRDN
ncbi:MAG: FISUMP domain-containing protein [Fibrobacteria bacterium]